MSRIGATGGLMPVLSLLGLIAGGCMPENVDSTPPIVRTDLQKSGQFLLASEMNVNDALWLEVLPTEDAPGIGGYIWPGEPQRRSLLIVLPGASTLDQNGVIEHALTLHRHFGPMFRDAGFQTWTLARKECGSPYGEEDLRQTLAAIDWLKREGAAQLGIDRIYLLGYSTGGTLAALASGMRDLDGVAVVSGVLDPQQIFTARLGFELFAALFPRNECFCQLGETLRAYGPNGNSAWERLNSVARLGELKSPTLVVHGGQDPVYAPSGFFRYQERYYQLRDAGVALPPVEFAFLPNGDHFETIMTDESQRRIADYFKQRDTAAPIAMTGAPAGGTN